jgi:hypothetical protein
MLENSWQPQLGHDLSSMDKTDDRLVLVLGDNLTSCWRPSKSWSRRPGEGLIAKSFDFS